MTNNPNEIPRLRRQMVDALQAGDKFLAIHLAKALLETDASLRQISFIARQLEKAPQTQSALKPLKVALLSSFSIEFLRDALAVRAFLGGVRLALYLPAFGQYQQEIRNPASGLYACSPDLVILAVEGSDWLPELYQRFLKTRSDGFDTTLTHFRQELQGLLETFRSNCKATLLINNFAPPTWSKLGILDAQCKPGQATLVHGLNDFLSEVAQNNPGVFILDYASLVSRHGALRWYDDRMSLYAKAPIALEMLPFLAHEYAKFFRALTGHTRKCVVLDLDNTLWGGVLGEDGLEGIQIGAVYPGSAYLAFQEAILDLHKRGVLLAIASKNNPGDVDEVFARHDKMALKREHFANLQVHWRPKSESLQQIARELNIGLEHIVFVDDNPAECAEIARHLPMVTTINLPAQPERFVAALLEDGLFDGLSFSIEDRRRGELYKQRDEAEALRSSSASLEEFYENLAMEVTFAPVKKESLARSAQLTQKTNQLNVTTFRYSEGEVADRMQHPDWSLTTATVRDRFGDNGIVGLSMARFDAETLEIDTFLLSCRVIGRGVESAMLAHLCKQGLQRGVRTVRGRIIPTPKNVPVRELFERHGFSKISEAADGSTVWTLDLQSNAVTMPKWIKVLAGDEVVAAL